MLDAAIEAAKKKGGRRCTGEALVQDPDGRDCWGGPPSPRRGFDGEPAGGLVPQLDPRL
jgi:hypothetical protein